MLRSPDFDRAGMGSRHSQLSREPEVLAVSRFDTSDVNCVNSGHYPGTNKLHVSAQTDGSLIRSGSHLEPFQQSL